MIIINLCIIINNIFCKTVIKELKIKADIKSVFNQLNLTAKVNNKEVLTENLSLTTDINWQKNNKQDIFH